MCPETCWSNFRLFIGLLEASSIVIISVCPQTRILSLLQMLLQHSSGSPGFFLLFSTVPPVQSPPTLWSVKQRSHTLVLLVPEMSCHSYNGGVAMSTNMPAWFQVLDIVTLMQCVWFSCIFLKNGTSSSKNSPTDENPKYISLFPSDNLYYSKYYIQLNL